MNPGTVTPKPTLLISIVHSEIFVCSVTSLKACLSVITCEGRWALDTWPFCARTACVIFVVCEAAKNNFSSPCEILLVSNHLTRVNFRNNLRNWVPFTACLLMLWVYVCVFKCSKNCHQTHFFVQKIELHMAGPVRGTSKETDRGFALSGLILVGKTDAEKEKVELPIDARKEKQGHGIVV